jgi:C4-dicarboxylate transporter DctQ subunit
MATSLSRLHAALRLLRRAEELGLVCAVLLIAALNLVNVCSRGLLGSSLAFVEELSRFSMIWITFLGLGYAASRGRHIRMTALYDTLPERPRKTLLSATSWLTSALCFYLCWLSLSYVLGTVRSLGAVSPVLAVPRWLVYLAAPLGFCLAGLQYALAGVRNLLSDERYLSFTEQDEYEDHHATR